MHSVDQGWCWNYKEWLCFQQILHKWWKTGHWLLVVMSIRRNLSPVPQLQNLTTFLIGFNVTLWPFPHKTKVAVLALLLHGGSAGSWASGYWVGKRTQWWVRELLRMVRGLPRKAHKRGWATRDKWAGWAAGSFQAVRLPTSQHHRHQVPVQRLPALSFLNMSELMQTTGNKQEAPITSAV